MTSRASDDRHFDDAPICEGIVTTLDEEGSPHVAPMGPRVVGEYEELLLRPFRSSRTLANLKRTRAGCFHVTDDVALIARAAVEKVELPPDAFVSRGLATASRKILLPSLVDCCRRFAFEVVDLDDSAERTRIRCRVIAREEVRPFFGFCRAQFACLELAILVTRRHLYAPDVLADEIVRLETILDKTGGPKERATFAMLREVLANEDEASTLADGG